MPWQPTNKYCWDFWFAYDKEKNLHAFFLQASQLESAFDPSRRSSISSVGHAILTEYGWKEVRPRQPALARRKGDRYWDNFSIWTGSIVEKDGDYYMFYTSRKIEDPLIRTPQERQRPQNIGIAKAKNQNLIHWSRTDQSKREPVLPNPGEESDFDGVNWRDPYVIEDEFDKQFYCFICARPQDAPKDSGGVIAYASSPSITEWGNPPEYKTLYASKQEFYQIEVPQVFWRKNIGANNTDYWRLYLLFSPQEKDASNKRRYPRTGTYYVYSQPIEDRTQVDYSDIPWENESATLLVEDLFAGKLVSPESEKNPVFFGFQFEDQRGHFVGGISDPKWAVFHEDGSITLTDEKPVG
jgi:beta-fructofuranosidase